MDHGSEAAPDLATGIHNCEQKQFKDVSENSDSMQPKMPLKSDFGDFEPTKGVVSSTVG